MADKPNITKEGYVAQLVKVGVWATPQNPIQYAFLEQKPAYIPNEPGFAVLSAAQRAAVQRAMAMISEVVNLTFVQVADNQQQPGPANPRIAFYANSIELSYSGGMFAFRVDDSYEIYGADIRFNTARIAQRQTNEHWWDFTAFVALHEVLHAMGLSHPGNYNGQGPTYVNNAEFVEDTVQYSVMSYFAAANTGADHFVGSVLYGGQTPLLYDILALQSLYAPNMTTRAGDTIYGFNSNTGADSPFNFAVNPGPVVAIWDAGGIDTIDLSGYSGASLIDLNEGAFSDAGGMTKNIAIAFNVTIENAVGGPGADRLIGNNVANRLDGGAGADQMEGGLGDDVYLVDNPGDVVVELAGAGTDELRTALATYVLPANVERLTGTSPSAQTLTGNDLANILSGGAGDDTLFGGAGDDQLEGGAGEGDTAVYAGNRADYEILTSGQASVRDLNAAGGDEGRDSLTGVEFLRFADMVLQIGVNTNNPPQLGEPAMADQIWADGQAAAYTIPGTSFIDLDGQHTLAFRATLSDGSAVPAWLSFDAPTRTFSGMPPVGAIGATLSVRVTADDGMASIFDDFLIGVTQAPGADVIGTGGPDLLEGSFRAERMFGLDGDDVLRGSAGADQVHGGAGTDQVDYGASPAGMTIDLLTGLASGGHGDGDQLFSIERVAGSPHTDLIIGSDGNDALDGGAGDDTVRGGGGDDVLTAGAGLDLVEGGSGFDILVVDYSGAAAAIVMAVPSGDAQFGYSGTLGDGAARRVDYNGIEAFTLSTGSGNDLVRGGGNFNTISLGAGDDIFHGVGGADTADGGAGVDGVTALGLGGQPILWDLAANSFSGGPGSYTNFEYFITLSTGLYNDVIVTHSLDRADTMQLGAGEDKATVVNGFDSVDGQAGIDTLVIDYSAATGAVTTTGIAAGSDGSGIQGRIGDGGTRRVDFNNVERFDVRTGSGNDVIVLGTGALATNDAVSLGAGDDAVDFGRGVDQGDGGAGIDSLAADISLSGVAITFNLVTGVFSGPAGFSFVNFEYFGGTGLRTGEAADIVVTSTLNRNDVVALGQSNDSVTLYDGHDNVFGGRMDAGAIDTGLDTLILDYSAATNGVHNVGALQTNGAGAFGQIGDDSTRLATFQAIDRFLVTTGTGNDNIVTAGGNDEVRTGAGLDTIATGGGDDLLDGGTGADAMAGGAGNDLYFVDHGGDSVTELAGEGTDTVSTPLAVYALAANLENLTGTSATGQVLTGNGNNNVVTAGGGNDVLHLWVGGGSDTVLAGAGMDNIFFGATLTSADVVNGGAGVDTLVVQGPYGSLTLTASITQIENLSILGGNNTNFGEPGTNRYDYVLTTHDANFAAGVQARINGAALLEGEDFTFNGSAETDASYVVYGGKGRDTLTGGLGNDIFFYAEERFASGDTVNGGAGYDGMFLRGNYTIDFNAPGYTGLFTNIENLTLTSATDERYARGGGTEFDYNLTLSDAIVGAGQELTISGALLMATETMVLDASQETNGTLRLFGGKAADTLKGGALADFLHGNLGGDTLVGGGGADVFRYDSAFESYSVNMDHILDFTPGTDRIDLERVDANERVGGNQAFTWIGTNAFSGQAGELRIYQSNGSWFAHGDVNGDGYGDLLIKLTLQGPTPLGAGDFVL